MSAVHLGAMILALSKHQLVGTVGIVAGVLVIGFGVLRILQRAAGALLLGVVGLIVIVLGVLAYSHTI